ncbi:ABC transporter permease [Paraglaciecola sp. MB-3u-78]|jgi:putative ABC transport system permease protein|uniref:ABC transporter permease n=1 Tax=Paraglaciecola sp. MB-3u-78 TaxID=2058332 RepID=UPI000C3355E2|nr:ABC transporter permease [Paraglaciecola sp. MB-3u-78]PKG99423.1 ABC transporter substrate-binding protein [Paraglaciecola sp. MB-3u-78]
MFNYYLALSLKSISRQKSLSLLISTTLGIGIAACMITYSLIHLMSKDPLPNKSERVYHIQLDNWNLNSAAISPDLPPEEVTWRDAMNIVHAKQAKYQAAHAITWGMVTPADKNVPPFLGIVRATQGEFFPMFEVPFLYGQGWQNYPANHVEYVAVLSKSTNQRIFGGVNSVGQTLPMLGKLFRVVGVLDEWHPSPKFFDMSFGAFYQPEDLYVPLQIKAELELPHGGSSNCWETDIGEEYQAFLNSECVNFNLWIELASDQSKQQFEHYLQTYVEQQKALGRFPKVTNNIVLNINQWLAHKEVVGSDMYLFFYLGLLFLLVCLFNAASLMSTKFTAKNSEIALRRALGANQQAIFFQCLTETIILGCLGALIGLVLCLFGLEGIKYLYPNFSAFVYLDMPLMLMTVGISILSSVLAGLLPSIKVCILAPAEYIK